ncbi:MAG: glutamate dehydrogenase, partial [Chlamydiia bacterium]|nr:glutamate dehydrogenase [Chlamydiia bacterium]
DSSENKTGVICSSFEVLSGLTLGDKKFVQNKKQLVKEILKRLEECAFLEANLMLKTHHETGHHLTVISDKISEKINFFTYQLLDFLDTITLSKDPNDPLLKCFYNYCLPLLRKKYPKELMQEIPDHHKKAIIACTIGSHVVYHKGIEWNPNICDILPLLIAEFK